MKIKFLSLITFLFSTFWLCNCAGPEPCDSTPESDLFPCSKANLRAIRSGISSKTVFNNTQQIIISQFSYPSTAEQFAIFGGTIEALGDSSIEKIGSSNYCCTYFKHIDKYPDQPTFKWDAFQSNLIAAAIFKDVIKLSLDGKRIQNIEDIVWTWNSGMGSGSQSSGKVIIEYQDGKDVKDGETLTTLTKLEKNTTYFWAVWAWDETGKDVIFSSRAIPFIVEDLPILPVTSIRQLKGSWDLDLAIKKDDGSNFTTDFPIQGFTGSIYCRDINEDVYEIEIITFPKNYQFFIAGNNEANEYLIEDVTLYDLQMACDNIITGKAKYNNVVYEVRYSQ